jgi:ubiquinone/menaquinone biosynthesis C-methylase UbiE/DNA-binding HxlR family transcriptional regulator
VIDEASLDDLVQVTKAIGEPTRLRIIAVLDTCELTVTELCRILGQSQPRVSRHLKLLCEAGVLERHAEGSNAFHRTARTGAQRTLVDALLSALDATDPVVMRDHERLAAIRAERAEAATSYFETVASNWDRVRSLHVSDTEVEAALLHAVDGRRIDDLLDIGTGTGRILELFADRIAHGLGVDMSREMLRGARSRLDDQRLTHCSVRQASAYNLDLADGCIDVAVLHHVLHFLDDPAESVMQAARTLRPQGLLLIVDFAPHDREQLRAEYAHRRLGFTDDEVVAWCERAGLVDVNVQHLCPATATADSLTVSLWTATQRSDAPALYNLEAAS